VTSAENHLHYYNHFTAVLILSGTTRVNRVQGYVNDVLKADGLRKCWGFRVGTSNVDSLTGRAGEVVKALLDRKVDSACIQKTRRMPWIMG